MQVQIPHKFLQAEAIAQIKKALDDARPKMGAEATVHEERWEDNVLHFDVTAQGQRISGTVTVNDTNFDIYAKLPFMLRMFEGKIEKAIKEQSKQVLG